MKQLKCNGCKNMKKDGMACSEGYWDLDLSLRIPDVSNCKDYKPKGVL